MKLGSTYSACMQRISSSCCIGESGTFNFLVSFQPSITRSLMLFHVHPKILVSFRSLLGFSPAASSTSYCLTHSLMAYCSSGVRSSSMYSKGAWSYITFFLMRSHESPLVIIEVIPRIPVSGVSSLANTTILSSNFQNSLSRLSNEVSLSFTMFSSGMPIIFAVCIATLKSLATAGRLSQQVNLGLKSLLQTMNANFALFWNCSCGMCEYGS